MPTSVEDLITTAEACALLGVDSSTLTRWADRRLLPEARRITPAYKFPGVNGAYLWRRGDVTQLATQLVECRSA